MMNEQSSLSPAAASHTAKALVLYDGQCPLCQRSVQILKRLDWLHRLDYGDARDESNVPALSPPLQPSRLMEEMHLVAPDGRSVYHGFRAFRWMAWRLPLLWPIAPFLYLPGMPALGQRVYRWIARNRFHLVPCEEGECRVSHAAPLPSNNHHLASVSTGPRRPHK